MSDDHGIAAAKKSAGWMPAAGKELKRLPSLLREGEQVLAMAPGKYGGGLGLVVATDSRVLVMFTKIFREVTEDLPYAKLAAVQWDTKFATGKCVFTGSGINVEVTDVASVSGEKLVHIVREQISGGGGKPASAPPTPDLADQLGKLASLRDAGVLSEDEFAAKKADILSRM